MPALATGCLTRVSSTSVDMKTAGATELYAVTPGMNFVPVCVVIRNISASLAGGTDYDFGDTTVAADSWRQSINLSAITTPADKFVVIYSTDRTQYTSVDTNDAFHIKVSTGSTAACTATVDLFGYLFPAY